MKYQVFLLPKAQRDLNVFKGKELSKLTRFISKLSENPRLVGSIKLTGDGGYRIRAGVYRILYRIDDAKKSVYVYRVRHRREVYR